MLSGAWTNGHTSPPFWLAFSLRGERATKKKKEKRNRASRNGDSGKKIGIKNNKKIKKKSTSNKPKRQKPI